MTVNIPYGYTSTNAASVSKDVYRLCFGYTSLDYVLNTGAQSASHHRGSRILDIKSKFCQFLCRLCSKIYW